MALAFLCAKLVSHYFSDGGSINQHQFEANLIALKFLFATSGYTKS